MILELKEAKLILQQRYETVETDIDISDLLLRESNLTADQLRAVDDALGVELPDSFQRIVMQYDFGNVSLGAVFFGDGNHTGNYPGWLIENNTNRKEYYWWGNGERPPDYIEIAGTDGYVIFLDRATENICAFLRDEDFGKAEQIAQDFELFVRGAATIYCAIELPQERIDFIEKIKRAVGCVSATEFWVEMTGGVA
jgi:hypothetical protein